MKVSDFKLGSDRASSRVGAHDDPPRAAATAVDARRAVHLDTPHGAPQRSDDRACRLQQRPFGRGSLVLGPQVVNRCSTSGLMG
jgi:hypothetical protein